MFTGIIKEVGTLIRMERRAGLYRMEVGSRCVSLSVEIGGSVSVNGACLTAVSKTAGSIVFDVMEETIGKTSFRSLRQGDPLNLEGSLGASGAMDGHFVAGHVDCAGKVMSVRSSGGEVSMEIDVGRQGMAQVIDKGSVAIDGVSLTVGRVAEAGFTVFLIPHTLATTNLGRRKAGDQVNVEFDMIGKYVARALGRPKREIDEEFLRSRGF